MRHFLALLAVSLLALRVQPSPPPAALVPPTRDPLPAPAPPPCTRPAAVPRPRHVTRRAERQRPAASGVPTNDDVQRHHGPRRRGTRHPREPVQPRTGRSVDSRSGGAIEGPEVPAPCPRYVRRVPTVPDAAVPRPLPALRGARGHHRDDLRRDRRITPSRPLVTFAAIGGDHLRRDQHQSALPTRVLARRKRLAHCEHWPGAALPITSYASVAVFTRFRSSCAIDPGRRFAAAVVSFSGSDVPDDEDPSCPGQRAAAPR